MTMIDKINAATHSMFSSVFDKEAPSYLEAAAAYAIIGQGRVNAALLSAMYNHARDPELRTLLRQAIEKQNSSTVETCENILKEYGGELPSLALPEHKLQENPLEIPPDARMTDEEIILALATTAKAAQLALLSALQQSYQPHIALAYRQRLDEGLDFSFRILELALNRGWLPRLDKVVH